MFKVILGFEEFEASLPGLVDMGTCPFPKKQKKYVCEKGFMNIFGSYDKNCLLTCV